MKLDFYEKQIIKIENLMAKGQLQAATAILNAEIKMPYIPLRYEKRFKALASKIKNEQQTKSFNKQISRQETLEMLWLDDKKQMVALNLLSNYYLGPAKKEIKKRIETWTSPDKQSLLYELLVEQKIDIEIEINGKIFNPTKFSIFENKKTKLAVQEIKNLAFKSPQIEKLAMIELHKYLLLTFGQVNFPGAKIGTMLYNIVSQMFFSSKRLNKDELAIKQILGHKK